MAASSPPFRRATKRALTVAAAGALIVPLAFTGTAFAATPPAPPDVADQACANNGVPPSGFTDISGDVQKANIECIKAYGVTSGKTATKYAPQEVTTRQQMALFIYNLLGTTDAGSPPDNASCTFTDINGPGTTAGERTAICALAGTTPPIAQGYSSTRFGPGDRVRRDQMASFIVRALRYAGATITASGADYFTDDNSDTAHQGDINDLASTGIIQGAGGGKFNPLGSTTRSNMAGFMGRGIEYAIENTLATSKFPPTNQTLSVTPTDASTLTYVTGTPEASSDTSDDRTFSVSGLDDAKTYNITLADAAGVLIEGGNGPVRLVDDNGNNAPDSSTYWGSTPGANITEVNGTAVGSPSDNQTGQPSGGTLTFTIDGQGPGSLYAFVWQDANSNGKLDLTVPSTTNTLPKTPAEAFGMGGLTSYRAVEGSTGGSTTAKAVDTAADYYSGTNNSYNYDSNDTFKNSGTTITMAQFESMLNIGDTITSTYDSDPAGVSTFDITTDTVNPPGTPTAATSGSDVLVTFAPNGDAASGDTYTLQSRTCGGGAFTDVAGATQANNADGTVTFTDSAPAAGCWEYQVTANSTGDGAPATSSTSNQVTV